jgi:hypothetical protein
LISHKYRFIFIKTTKTAGTSIEVDLSGLMDEKDVVTELGVPEPGHFPRNTVVNGVPMWNHVSAREVQSAIGAELFNSYFRFCVEREPVDKCISHFSMLKESPRHNIGNETLTWEQYVERRQFPTDDAKYLSESGRLIVDRILKYENLNSELIRLADELGFPFNGLQAKAKSSFRKLGSIGITVNSNHKNIIYEEFFRSLQFTGYSKC